MKQSLTTCAVLAAAALAAAPAAVAAAPAPTRAIIDDCAGTAHTSPAGLTLYCGDANEWLARLRWTDWGSPAAQATGQLVANTCTPDCAAGHTRAQRASITVSGLRHGRYTRMTVNGQRWDLTTRGPALA